MYVVYVVSQEERKWMDRGRASGGARLRRGDRCCARLRSAHAQSSSSPVANAWPCRAAPYTTVRGTVGARGNGVRVRVRMGAREG